MDFSEMSEIIPGLYLSSVDALFDRECLRRHKIRTVLTILSHRPENHQPLSEIQYHFIELDDEDHQDILIYLDRTYEIIDESLFQRHHNVLVHCALGVSRSSTVVIAYLMRSKRLPFSEAMAIVKSKRILIMPNNGFRKQLALYEIADQNVTATNVWIKRYLLYRMAETSKHHDHFQRYLEFFRRITTAILPNQNHYKCKSCRYEVFNESDIIHHDIVTGSFYLAPVGWMMMAGKYLADQSEYVGKIECPRCRIKIGRFEWRKPWLGQTNFSYTVSGDDGQPWRNELVVPLVFSITETKVDRP